MTEKLNIVTIDGPAGVGKSTVSKRVAALLGFTYLDTGAMYRGVGLYLEDKGVDIDNLLEVKEALNDLALEIYPATPDQEDVGVKVNGRDVSLQIRTPEVAMIASRVSAIGVVRDMLTEKQREYGLKGEIVAEGRDLGTVVFPEAAFKFFLDGNNEERAKRRFAQLQEKGQDADYKELLAMITERDKNDRQRALAPLRQAQDAILVDTTNISIEQVVSRILEVVQS